MIDGPDNFPAWERAQNEAADRQEEYNEAAAICRESSDILRGALMPMRALLEIAEDEQTRCRVTQKDAGLGDCDFAEIRNVVESLFKGGAK